MIIAFLFDSDKAKLKGPYHDVIRALILDSGILQASQRHMKVRVGDVSIFGRAKTELDYLDLCERTYFVHPWRKLKENKLRNTFLKSTVYAWIIQNIANEIAIRLDEHRSNSPLYLGMHGIDFTYPSHLVLYRASMMDMYRIKGSTCNLFFSMGEADNKNHCEMKELRKYFHTVNWEDRGAHGSIFDDFATPEHFEQVKEFHETVTPYFIGGSDEVEELIMLLEDLDPNLFNTLGAAVRAINRARNEEDYAQVGLSGRRYLEQLADVLYPASATPHKGRRVTQDKHKNRLWAYIDNAIPPTVERANRVAELGQPVDRLFEEVNKVLHGSQDKERVIEMFCDLAKLTLQLLVLNPENARQPYYAFEKNITLFFNQVVEGIRKRTRQ